MDIFNRIKTIENRLKTETKSMQKLYDLVMELCPNNICCDYVQDNEVISLTFKEFNEEVENFAYVVSNKLKDVPKHSWVALKHKNNERWFIAFFGLLMAGYKVLLMDYNCNEELKEHLTKESGAKAFVISENISCDKYLSVNTEEIIKEKNISRNIDLIWEDEIAFCTSGTTGTSKIYGFNGERMVNQILNIISLFQQINGFLKEHKKILLTLPFHHIFGFILPFSFFLGGFELFFPKNTAITTIINTIKNEKITLMYSVPMFWNGLIRMFSNKDGSINKEVFFEKIGDTLKYAACGGSYTSCETLKAINNLGIYFMNGYGSTEAGIISLCTSHEYKDRISGSIGKGIPGKVKLLVDNTEIANDGIGELIISKDIIHSFTLCNGEKKQLDMLLDNWFETGDICRIENDAIYIEGRKKDVIINASGENIYPDELEECFKKELLSYENFCILGIQDCEKNDDVTLVIKYEEADFNNPNWYKEIINKVKDVNKTLPIYKKIKRVLVSTEQFPIVNGMKVKRNILKNMIENNQYKYIELNLKKNGEVIYE